MNHIEVAEAIARDASCAQGEFGRRVLSIIPYLTEHADEIERLREALQAIKNCTADQSKGTVYLIAERALTAGKCDQT